MSIKYFYKYVYKGLDRVSMEVLQGPNYDEVQQLLMQNRYVLQRHVGRYFHRLQIHLPGK